MAVLWGGAPPLPEPDTDPAEVGRLADEVLARPEFQPEQKGLVERAFDWVGDTLGDLLDGLFTGGGNALLAWFILALIVGAVAFLAVRLGRTVRADHAGVEERRRPPRRPPVEWLREAEEHEAKGEWRAALRCRYRALVGDLVARQLIPDVPGRTTGEYRREVADAAPAAAGDFAGATELFELAWYGHRPTGPDENARFRDLADRVLVEAGS